MSASTPPTAILVSNDGTEVRATLQAIKQSVTIRTMLEMLDEEHITGQPIPVPAVSGETLTKIMQWCEYHRDDPITKPDDKAAQDEGSTDAMKRVNIPRWDRGFWAMEKDLCFRVINGANYLEIPLLLDYGVQMIALWLKGKSTAYMREFLGLENDFTPEEEAEMRRQNWAT